MEVEERVQDLNTVTCGIFQIYFYDNLFNPDENSKIQDTKRLNKRTIETLLNKLFCSWRPRHKWGKDEIVC